MEQLTETYRPSDFSQMVGQERLVGTNGILTQMLRTKQLRSCIFYGPPGCGKTTAARILAEQSGMPFVQLNATTASTKDIQAVSAKAKETQQTFLLYLDEIQYFNKKQQQTLLSDIESGAIILISATTDNPFFCCIDALISRCTILEFRPVTPLEIQQKLQEICQKEQCAITNDGLHCISENAAGDIRRALNLLQTVQSTQIGASAITQEDVLRTLPSVRTSRFDPNSDIHYNLIAALQKSIRGSDPNAAVFYLARLLEGGDILSPCRRLLVIAHEDIGLGNPNAIPFVQSCVEAARQLGLPEAAKPLTNAVIYLAISPKCSTCETTYNAALQDVQNGYGNVVPKHINKGCPKDYKYPHNYPHHWVRQQYLPDDLVGRVYYVPGDNEFEQRMAHYWSQIIH